MPWWEITAIDSGAVKFTLPGAEMSAVGNADFRARQARRRGRKGDGPSRPGGYEYESSSFPTSPAGYDQFSWPPPAPGLSPYNYDSYDRYEKHLDRYDRYDRYEHDRYYRENEHDYHRYEQDRYQKYENSRYGRHHEVHHGGYEQDYRRYHNREYDRYEQKLPDYVDPRIPSTHPDPEYLAYLDSLYTPLEGMPQAPLSPAFNDWRTHDDWSANPHLFDAFDDANDAPAKEEHGRSKYFGDAPGSSCSTSDTDGQVIKVPTKGSAKHHLGSCKPCAFVYKSGCTSGYDCEFCHLCDPGEKKRRKKERKQQMRHVR